ncbi:MAG TPA: hypothetical protein VFE62_20970 [Gemmataceae bacterium]|nr:hypothetical protein [Gemmataceae bacterium]
METLLNFARLPVIIVFAGVMAIGLLYVHRQYPEAQEFQRIAEPSKGPGDGLHLHRWYRARANLGFSWDAQQWRSEPVNWHIARGVPLFVWERRGKVAVLRGAVRGEVLVPDGESAKWFVEAGELPPVGEAPWPAGAVGKVEGVN